MTQPQVLTRPKKRNLKNDTFKVVSVKHDQITQQEQSFAMVRALLLSAVATISWLRQLFPKDCYKKRNYADMQDDGRSLYHKFHGTVSSVPNSQAHPAAASWAMRVLARGKTRGADKLLDWVNAVIEAILRDNLSSVQFSIYTDKSNPMNILESYTFSFDYHKDVNNGSSNGRSQIVGMRFSEADGVPVTITSARSGLAQIIDRLLEMDIRLPALPADRFMTCHLFHRLNSLRPHLPQGFQPCQCPTFPDPDNGIWQMEKRDLGCMQSGFHDVNPKMVYIAHGTGTDADLITTQELSTSSQPENQYQYWLLKPSVSKGIEKKRTQILKNRFRNSETGGERNIRCECGQAEGATMLCGCCDARQHSYCYGFAPEESGQQHFCYQCLVPKSDFPSLQKLKSLVQFRRALWIAYKEGFPQSETAFAQILGYDLNATASIVQRMKDEGYIALDEKNDFVLVRSYEQGRVMDLEYFNPMTLVKKYYTRVELDGSDDSTSATSASINEPRPSHTSRKRRGCD